MKTRGSIATLAVLWALGCTGKVTVYEVIVNGGGRGASDNAANDGGASSSGGNAVSMAGTQTSFGGVATGGVAGDAARAGGPSTSGGAADVAGAGGEVGLGGAVGASGAFGASGAGDAGAGGVACDTPVADVPANCQATVTCTGAHVVDQANVPTPSNACLVGTCNAAGIPGTAPAVAETLCSAAGGGKLCDGAGKCVRCLQASDCADGQVCSEAHQCVVATCTDVDCGGACPPCGSGKKCLADADCVSFACDVVSQTCVIPQCQDHHQDGLETDADCGGGSCGGCVLGKSCVVDDDCASSACDALTLACVRYQCADHRIDSDETDIDCGGGGCQSCNVGQKCKSNFDCLSGHFCNVEKICQ